jgi:FG-GAP repeat/PKD domain
MKKILFEIFVCMLLIAAVIPSVNAVENWTEMQKLLTPDWDTNYLGGSSSIYGDTALISGKNIVHVFILTDNTWTEQANITVPDTEEFDAFGNSVSLYGDTALIGVFGDDDNGNDSGSAYVFTRSGNTWTQQAKLYPSDAAEDDWFGSAVSLYGDTALIGAPNKEENEAWHVGAAYVFIRTGNTWTQQQKLLATDRAEGDGFGCAVSLYDDTALIGATGDDVGGGHSPSNWALNIDDAGSAYIFTRSGTTWTQQARLVASDRMDDDQFGYQVSLSGNTALIGVPTWYKYTEGPGSAFVFIYNGNTWTQQAELIPSDGSIGDEFGRSLCIDGDTAIIGAQSWEVVEGSAYIYTRTGTTWTEQIKLLPSDRGEYYNSFGVPVSLYRDTAIVGARSANYVYTKGDENEQNQSPIASFTWTPSNPKANQTVTLEASASTDTDGTITNYEWDWNNDGTYEDSQTTATITHSWSQAGSYPVILRVTDNSGSTSTKTLSVTMSSAGSGGGGTKNKGTPGFELIIVICAIAMLLLWKRKRKL